MHSAYHCLECNGRTLIDELNQAADLTDFTQMLNQSARLSGFAKNMSGSTTLLENLVAMAKEDALSSLFAIEALSEMQHKDTNKALVDCLTHPDISVRRQVAWKLARRHPIPAALPLLIEQLSVGGIDTMHAHQTLSHWAHLEPILITKMVLQILATNDNDDAMRARLVDLIGVLITPDASEILSRLAVDTDESLPVRLAAISAIGSRTGSFDALLNQLANSDNEVGTYATLAINDQKTLYQKPRIEHDIAMRICQLVLAKVDHNLSSGGRGETGGVASLLVSLGKALTRQPGISQVITIGVGSIVDAIASLTDCGNTPLSYGIIAAGDAARPMNSTNAWEHLPVIKRGIKRVLFNFGSIDLMHLRMLDVATLAASQVANDLAIPICFSFAPDPHNLVQSLCSSKQLNRVSFLAADAKNNLWFRARMLEHMARNASQLAVFPQPKCRILLQDIRKGSRQHKQRSVTIAEGIDIGLIHQAAQNYSVTHHNREQGIIGDLARQICTTRRHLPILLSVGRFHPGKGMERVVIAWAGDPRLYNRCNLVIAGGNLDCPSSIEMGVISAINKAVPLNDSRRSGLTLLGGRSHSDVACLMIATMKGQVGYWASGGIYVDGAPKEEFGLALLEALATGLVVVAPSAGGPLTYIEHGDTGILVDSQRDLGYAIHQGFGLVNNPGRISRVRKMVAERYTIDTMAKKLASLYLTGRDQP